MQIIINGIINDMQKTAQATKSHKSATGSALPKNEKTCMRLRLMGALMAFASVLMALLPMMYSGIYRYIAAHVGDYISNFGIKIMILTGFVSALLYFLLGLFSIRAGERNTRLVRGVYQLNNVLTFLAIVAGVLLFLPWPVPTFKLMMTHLATSAYIEQGIVPMFIMLFVDTALIIGLLASITSVSYTCLIDSEKK
ncbi:hypothetical protein IKQ74_02200 [Candidatus Saccharibacteria bacterium]|nr:hypothetical protein [Candidatus Saccharibacteria bacterium]